MIVGIDLGTTNSAVAIWRDGRPELIPNSLGQVLTPSAVGLDDDGRLLVGLAARERQVTHPELTATTFKRYMGSRRETRLGGKTYSPEELSALVLAVLKADCEAFLGEPVTEAVITVPAYFNDKQRKATRRAGELAGLKVERLLNEPTAAALAYGIHRLKDESRFLVFDLGGGTFDVSILEIFEGVIEVRASTGDNQLGGEDFNALIVKDIRARFATAWGKNSARSEALLQRLRYGAERVRRALTTEDTASVNIVWDGRTWSYAITAETFESMSAGLLARLRDPVLRALRDSDIRAESLDEIILVGGATRMPVVRRVVTRMFDRFPAFSVNPDEAVALGAAVLAGLKARDIALKDVVVTDVAPYSLGVDSGRRMPDGTIKAGIFSPIIERNTVIPASRQKIFYTIQDNQPLIKFSIFQGESREVTNNVLLGQISLPVPPGSAGQMQVECRFTYDVNGLLEVDLHVPQSGERGQLVITDEEGPSGQDLQKRREALAALKVHPRDLAPVRAALARADRCYETSLGDTREYLSQATQNFELILEHQDPREVERARLEFTAMLDALEGKSFL